MPPAIQAQEGVSAGGLSGGSLTRAAGAGEGAASGAVGDAGAPCCVEGAGAESGVARQSNQPGLRARARLLRGVFRCCPLESVANASACWRG